MRRTVGSPWLENRRSPRLASGPSLLPLLSSAELLPILETSLGPWAAWSAIEPSFGAPRRSRGLSQPGYDDEQGADHADEDQRSETDPHPLLERRVFPAHFGSRPWSATCGAGISLFGSVRV